MFDIDIIGIKFSSRNKYGDFYWMNKQNDKYSGSLFIFNDNEEYHDTCSRGCGNAVMRQFNKYSNHIPPSSAGIPTGTLKSGGYIKFTSKVKKVIDNSFDEIIELITKYKYHTIYFSSELDGKLGTSLFEVNPKVIEYITSRIYKLSNNPVRIVRLLSNDIFEDDFDLDNADEVEEDENEDKDEEGRDERYDRYDGDGTSDN